MNKLAKSLLVVALLFGGAVSAQEAKTAPQRQVENVATVEQSPSFPGGYQAMSDFIGKNLKYPEQATKNGVQGKVLVSFVVETDGSITDVKVIRGIGSGCDEEAVRVVKAMPKWQPAMKEGKAVAMQFYIPFSFVLPKK